MKIALSNDHGGTELKVFISNYLKKLSYEIINLGGGRNPVSLNTIIEKLETLLGKRAKIDHKPFHIADLMETWANIDKAKDLLPLANGWAAKKQTSYEGRLIPRGQQREAIITWLEHMTDELVTSLKPRR